MGGYSYKKRNKAVKQSFKNRRSSPRNINIMVGGEEPVVEESEMVGGTLDDNAINAGFAAIDNYFKTAFISKDVNKVYIENDKSVVEVLTRSASAITPVAITPPITLPITPGAGAGPISYVNANTKIAISTANVMQKALNVLNAATEASKEEKIKIDTVTATSAQKLKDLSSSTPIISVNNRAHSEINNIVDSIKKIFTQDVMLTQSTDAYEKLNTTLTEFNTALTELNKL